jgi:AraC family transcriptional regulator of arabinose operon
MALHLADDDDPESRHIRRLITAACDTPPRDFDERYHTVEAILLACRRIDPNSRPTRDERLQRAVDHVTLHFATPITLDALTGVAGVSASQLARLFIKHAGMSPRDFVELVRMRHANYLLDHTDLPVHEIARRCGFADPHYFSNRYKRFSGVSPRGLRKKNAATKRAAAFN